VQKCEFLSPGGTRNASRDIVNDNEEMELSARRSRTIGWANPDSDGECDLALCEAAPLRAKLKATPGLIKAEAINSSVGSAMLLRRQKKS